MRVPLASGSPNTSRSPHPGHQPVLLSESLSYLQCKPGGHFVDATVGLGGHARRILERIQPDGRLIGIDRDRESLEIARENLTAFGENLQLFHENYKNLALILNNLSVPRLDGIFLDLGVSSYQLSSVERGFSFQSDAMLDMRMDRSQRQTAADLVNELGVEQIEKLLREYGEERRAKRIAKEIVRARESGRISKCSQLAGIVVRAVRARPPYRIHPATRTFQALRIVVNTELEGLEDFLLDALRFLRPGGRIVVISFHSLEDRIVKTAFRKLAGRCVCGQPTPLCTCPRISVAEILTPRPVRPGTQEVEANPRSRSARLRAAERIAGPD